MLPQLFDPMERPLFDNGGGLVEPLVVVDLDSPATLAPLPADRLRVGVSTREPGAVNSQMAVALDVTLVPQDGVIGAQVVGCADPWADAELLHSAAKANPQAALVLAQVLRATRLDVSAALDLESFAYSTLLGGTEFARWLALRGPRPLPPPAPEPPVLVRRAGERLLITLNRPERRNAYGRDVRDALVEALRLVSLDSTIARVVLDGAGPSFCAGGDLDEFGTTPDLTTAHLVRTHAGAARLLSRLADRTEVHVHGTCVGAGIELPAFAGTVIARSGTVFRLPEVGMGLIPGAGGTVSIARRIGRWRTLFLALTGRSLDVTTAFDWGLIDAIE